MKVEERHEVSFSDGKVFQYAVPTVPLFLASIRHLPNVIRGEDCLNASVDYLICETARKWDNHDVPKHLSGLSFVSSWGKPLGFRRGHLLTLREDFQGFFATVAVDEFGEEILDEAARNVVEEECNGVYSTTVTLSSGRRVKFRELGVQEAIQTTRTKVATLNSWAANFTRQLHQVRLSLQEVDGVEYVQSSKFDSWPLTLKETFELNFAWADAYGGISISEKPKSTSGTA